MYLLDTNVVSELRKLRTDRIDQRFARWASTIKIHDLYVSTLTIYELERGVLKMQHKDPRQGQLLRDWMDAIIPSTFGTRILPVTEDIARLCAGLGVPDPRPLVDGIIAATALSHDLTIVTRNVADFRGTGTVLIDPWAPQA